MYQIKISEQTNDQLFVYFSITAWKIDTNNPGTDLACETAAALAAASILFKEADPTYSEELLTHAKQLYEFGDTHRGIYSDSITNAADFYK